MKQYVVLLLTGFSLVGGAACTGSSAAFTAPSPVGAPAALDARPSLGTIVDIATGNPNFSTLVAALDRAGLVATFQGSRHYTVFAPTNAAFDAAAAALVGPGATGLDLVNGLPIEALAAVLSYHVTRGDRNATSVVSAGSVVMLDKNAATISVANGGAKIDNANIVTTDLRASNGIVHVIDAVLLPPSLQ
jgi:uncharacterized surface protein with fasciclin (FAS1) repeats